VRTLPGDALPDLASELRAFLVERVSVTGGHLGPNLGVVELTIALHRVFDSPQDAVLFDTGHQTYVHKVLTGRGPDFGTLRQQDGLSGYPCRAESEHDWIENSHASTALSYADGLAKARVLDGDRGAVVAVVGDGALTGGMAWEALNNIGACQDRPVIVVLNDNGRSYAPTTGGFAKALARLRAEHTAAPRSGKDFARRNLFTEMGFAYLGPVDGHDEPAVESALEQARALRCPVVVHVVTVKGKGYRPAEEEPAECMHAIGPLTAATGQPAAKAKCSWTDVFAQELVDIAERRQDVVAVTAAMPGPTGLAPFAQRFPQRFFDVGIAEQHAVTSAAGLAMGGKHPVVAVYATFLSRAFDQMLMDVALHELPVTFVLDRAGITGPDGPSHHGMWDIGLAAHVPGLRLAIPRDPTCLRRALSDAVDHDSGPTLVRYPKSSAGADILADHTLGSVDILTSPRRPEVLLVAYGPLAAAAQEAAVLLGEKNIPVTVAAPTWALPVSEVLLELADTHRLVVSVEDGLGHTGAGAALAHAMRQAGITTPVHHLGLPTAFLPAAPRADLLQQIGLSQEYIALQVLRTRTGEPVQSPVPHGHGAPPGYPQRHEDVS
jgi:1-deoxy-D-xylulose-5-phosphate synthase